MKQRIHRGLYPERLKPEAENPREVAFAEQWQRENDERGITPTYYGCTLDQLLKRRADEKTIKEVATIIQWLGSNVGFSFLGEALARCGYRIGRK